MSDIFISYKREEQSEARKLANALEQQGWGVWWDPKLRAGEHFDDVIEAALEKAKCVIVMWSRLSVQSRYVKDEATYALKFGKLVPVAIEEVKLPFRFAGIHTPQLTGWGGLETASEFRRLVEDISGIIRPPVTEPGEKKPSVKREQPRKPMPKLRKMSPESGTIFCDTLRDGSKGPDMVVIPPGQFEMGDIWDDGLEYSKPVHTVIIRKPFALGRYPVTFYQYDVFATATSRELPGDEEWGRGQRPVINVSWEDVVAYCEWLSQQTGKHYRLPFEAEWEYAARSGGGREKWAGTSAEKELGDYAWYCQNSGEKTQPVGRKKPNGLGLYDMSGNVCEWIEDGWNEVYVGAPDDGTAWTSRDAVLRVIRGGSWLGHPRYVRSAGRDWTYPDIRGDNLGFRLAQDI